MWLYTRPHGRVRAVLPWASPAPGPDPNPVLLILGLERGLLAHFWNSLLPSAYTTSTCPRSLCHRSPL